MAVRRRWLLAKTTEEEEGRLAAELGVSRLLARLLVNRNVNDAERAGAFLGAKLSTHLRSPMLFRHMGAAAGRVVRAVGAAERIGIYGDYDVDGVSGSAVLVRFLRALGSEPILHIPHRLRDGYGLSEPGVRRLAEQGARVMITVDCGGVSHREIGLAAELGMDTIVCDHHQVSGVPLPAHAVLNPIEPDAGFPFAGLCGAGVAFYLALGVRMMLRDSLGDRVPDLRRYLDLVALGTVADLVPIVEENRVLVKYGLRELANSDRPGVVALKAVSGVDSMNTGVVGFRLAPRLNAGGRLADARRSVELLVTEDRPEAERLAADLDAENRARQAIERQIVDEAVAMIEEEGGIGERRSIVLASPDWHPGVIGIVASRLVERYYRPTVLIASNCGTGIGRGSGRSIRGFNLYEALSACREHLAGFGGHRMAVGLSIDPGKVAALQASFENAVRERTSEEDFIAVRDVDCEVGFRALDASCLDDLERLEPYGQGNPEPVLLARGVEVRHGKVVGDAHLKLQLQQEGRVLSAIGFGMADQSVEPGTRLDILFSPMVREWAGSTTLELRLRDFRPCGR
jgi:single-stranded-DNA-specific exonuclease